MPVTITEKFQHARQRMFECLLERDEEIDLLFIALIAEEHLVLVGNPGLGKSLLLRALSRWLNGSYFEYLMTRYTEPVELFGPVSIKRDEVRLLTEGMLPDAELVFLSEIFKGSSAILNCLLGVLNERVFRYGRQVVPCRLQLCLGDSNEWPNAQEGGESLGALYDRFLLRKKVRPLAGMDSKEKLLFADNLEPTFSPEMTPGRDELIEARTSAQRLPISAEAKELYLRLWNTLRLEGIMPGDRRMRKSVKAVRACAWLEGATEVQPVHLEVLKHCLWEDPLGHPEKCAKIILSNVNPGYDRFIELMSDIEKMETPSTFSAMLQSISLLEGHLTKLKDIRPETPRIKRGVDYVARRLTEQKKAAVSWRDTHAAS
jgi:MoxR-like ATPase